MKTKRLVTLGLLSLTTYLPTMAAGDETFTDENSPKGKAIITVFSDFHAGFGNVNDDRGFDLNRAYVGYQYDLPYGLQLKAVVDFGKSDNVDDYHRIGYIKNAQVAWKRGKWTLNAGLINTIQFKFQEGFWGKRYVMKSFQDEYAFGSSADLAVSATCRFNDYLSADAILANGEGYKKVQVKDGMQYGAGVTLNPADGLFVRMYASFNEASSDGLKGITNVATFAGYKNSVFSIAAEYNWQSNTGYVVGNDKSGISAYASIQFNEYVGMFGRWDYLTSENDWNIDSDGMAGVLGAEFRLGKYVRLAPNFRIWSPGAEGVGKSGYFYLSASFSL